MRTKSKKGISIGIKVYAALIVLVLAFCAYNAGMGNVDKWLLEEQFEIKFAETQIYVNKLEVIIDKYKSLYYR